MRRLCRWVYPSTELVSLVLLSGICIEWFRGYRVQDSIDLRNSSVAVQQLIGFSNCTGAVWLAAWKNVAIVPLKIPDNFKTPEEADCRWHLSFDAYDNPQNVPPFQHPIFEHFGFHVSLDRFITSNLELPDGQSNMRQVNVIIPDWFLFGLLMTTPCLWLFHRLRSRSRFAAGKCRACGYDLRATPECCPECGTTQTNFNAVALEQKG